MKSLSIYKSLVLFLAFFLMALPAVAEMSDKKFKPQNPSDVYIEGIADQYYEYSNEETESEANERTGTTGTGSRAGSSYVVFGDGTGSVNYGYEKGNPKSGDVYTIDAEGNIKKVGDLDKDNDGHSDQNSGTAPQSQPPCDPCDYDGKCYDVKLCSGAGQ